MGSGQFSPEDQAFLQTFDQAVTLDHYQELYVIALGRDGIITDACAVAREMHVANGHGDRVWLQTPHTRLFRELLGTTEVGGLQLCWKWGGQIVTNRVVAYMWPQENDLPSPQPWTTFETAQTIADYITRLEVLQARGIINATPDLSAHQAI